MKNFQRGKTLPYKVNLNIEKLILEKAFSLPLLKMAMHSTQSSTATKKGTELHKKENRKTGKHIENMVRKTQQKKVPTNYRFTAA